MPGVVKAPGFPKNQTAFDPEVSKSIPRDAPSSPTETTVKVRGEAKIVANDCRRRTSLNELDVAVVRGQ